MNHAILSQNLYLSDTKMEKICTRFGFDLCGFNVLNQMFLNIGFLKISPIQIHLFRLKNQWPVGPVGKGWDSHYSIYFSWCYRFLPLGDPASTLVSNSRSENGFGLETRQRPWLFTGKFLLVFCLPILTSCPSISLPLYVFSNNLVGCFAPGNTMSINHLYNSLQVKPTWQLLHDSWRLNGIIGPLLLLGSTVPIAINKLCKLSPPISSAF